MMANTPRKDKEYLMIPVTDVRCTFDGEKIHWYAELFIKDTYTRTIEIDVELANYLKNKMQRRTD